MTSGKKPYGEVWTPPADDKVSPPQTLPADFDGWDDAPAPIPVAQQQAKARAKRTANAPGWQEAMFPNMTAAGGNPMQDIRTFGAGFKDLAALPVNLASGAMAALAAHPGDASQDARYAMASKGQGDMDQNQRAVLGLSMAGGPIGKVFERVLPEIRSSAPLMRGLARLVRGGGAGVAESVPAATFQAAIGDFGGGMENLAIGGAAGGLMRGVGLIPKSIDKAAGNMAGSMSGIPQRDLRKIGFLGNSEYGQKILSVAGDRQKHVNDLGRELLDRTVRRFDEYLPNADEVNSIVANLPDIKTKSIIDALERSKTAVKIKGKPGSVTRGSADVFDSPAASEFKASTGGGGEVFQDLPRLGAPNSVVSFSNVSTQRRPGLSGLLGMDEKGLPAIRRNPQVIPDAEPVGSAGYSVYQKGAKGKIVNAVPEDKSADLKIDDVIRRLKQASDANGYIPATVAREIRKRYDVVVGDAFGKESSAYINALKSGRHAIAQSLEEVAQGTPYAEKMADYTRMYRARDKVFQDLGHDAKTQEKRVEGYLSNLFQGNKSAQQQAFSDLSDLLGADFAERAKLLSDAKRIAPTGEIPFVSAHNTRKAGIGGGIVGGIGGLMYGLGSGNPGLMAASAGTLGLSALGSPALAPGILWGTRNAAQAAANPYARGLANLAGRSARSMIQAENAGQ